MRVSEWARELLRLGWKVNIITPRRESVISNELLKKEFGCNINLHLIPTTKIGGGETKNNELISEFLSAAASHFYLKVPDRAVIFWRRKSVLRYLKMVCSETNPDILITSSPPHSIHYAGLFIKYNHPGSIIWLADFRDPYGRDARYKLKGIMRLAPSTFHQFERKVHSSADIVSTAIPSYYDAIKESLKPEKGILIYNGFPDSLKINPRLRARSGQRHPRVTVTGFLDSGLASIIVDALRLVYGSGTFEFHVAGLHSQAEIIRMTDIPELKHHGAIEHRRALKLLIKSDILISALTRERSQYQLLSSKLFEYLATGTPTIAINPTNDDQRFLKNYSWASAIDVTRTDSSEATAKIAAAIEGCTFADLSDLKSFREEFNRCNQVKFLDEVLRKRLSSVHQWHTTARRD